MKAIVNTNPGRLEWLDRSTPAPCPGQVRIRTGAVGICATDLDMIAGWDRTGFPSIPGHEWAGTIDAVGPGVDPALAGQHCVAENVLSDGGEVGFEHPGGYGQYFLTEAVRVQPLPANFPMTTAILVEPLAVCVRALRRLTGSSGLGAPATPALVFGDGPIGLLMVLLLAQAGSTDITMLGGREGRLALARGFGARRTLNYHTLGSDLAGEIKAVTGTPFRTMIEASGSARAAEAALSLAAGQADILIVGDYGHGRASFPWNALLHQELRLIGSNASAGAWPLAVELACRNEAALARLVTHRFPADGFERGFELVRHRDSRVIKVALDWSTVVVD